MVFPVILTACFIKAFQGMLLRAECDTQALPGMTFVSHVQIAYVWLIFITAHSDSVRL